MGVPGEHKQKLFVLFGKQRGERWDSWEDNNDESVYLAIKALNYKSLVCNQTHCLFLFPPSEFFSKSINQ